MAHARNDAPAPPRVFSFQDVAGMLAQTLGREKSAEVVGVAAVALGYRGPLLTRQEMSNLLDHLARVPGLIGIAARFAQRRAQAADDRDPPSSVRPVSDRVPPPSDQSAGRIRTELVALLAQSLGIEKAEEEISVTTKRLGLVGKLDAACAVIVLEELAKTPGAIGATARFAKARFLLRSNK